MVRVTGREITKGERQMSKPEQRGNVLGDGEMKGRNRERRRVKKGGGKREKKEKDEYEEGR